MGQSADTSGATSHAAATAGNASRTSNWRFKARQPHGGFTWGVLDRLNAITFNSSPVKELRALALIQQLLREEGAPPTCGRAPLFAPIEALRMRRIAADAERARLGVGTKMNTAWAFLRRLHGIGRSAADEWLARNFTHIGRRSTLNLAAFLL
ncbi:MAG: hypothetical protein NZL99_01395 [Burkholderiaceae bacterium]|nr:hypothetical protein [Burkholderiaceae bacterium]